MDYNNYLNPTLVSIKPSGIRKFFSIAEEMDNVISLGVGEPDFKTPWHIRQTGINSLEQGATRYTANVGLSLLRDEIADYYKRKLYCLFQIILPVRLCVKAIWKRLLL